MKLSVATIVAVASAQDKKVPPRHPLQRLNKLNKFAAEWCNANLSEKAAANWEQKFDKNVARFERRFELCGFYDANSEHGGPRPAENRERRAEDDLAFLDCEGALCPRYDKNNPSVVFNKSPKVSPSGLNDTSPIANFNQPNKS